MLTRSFGLLSDFVENFDIVVAHEDKARLVTVWKPDSPYAPKSVIPGNNDLFWAVLGGSPGNFGILTHITIQPLHDKDYPDSRMMKFYVPYTKDRYKELLKVQLEMIADPDLPRNFDYFITITGQRNSIKEDQILGDGELNEDENMMLHHTALYGDGDKWAEEGKIPDRIMDGDPYSFIIVFFKVRGD